MSETLPTHEPASMSVGDSVRWKRRIEVYGDHKDPADSWVLTYRLVNANDKIEIACTDNGDGYHLASVTATTSADWVPGVYTWRAFVAQGSDRFTVGEGRICIEPNLADLDAQDLRSWARRMLDAIEALLENRATQDQQSYSIAGRSISRFSRAELMEQRRMLKREIANEDAAIQIAAGGPHRGITRVRI